MTGFTTATGLPAMRATALPRRRWRRLLPWFSGLAATMLVVAAAWLWIVPRVVDSALHSWLRQQGFGVVSIESIEVGFGHVLARNLRIGSAVPGTGDLTIATATAEFALADLWARRCDTLVLEAPIWTMAEAPGHEKSPFDGMLRTLVEAAPRSPVRSLPALAVRHVAVRMGRIELPAGSTVAAVAIDGTLTVVDGRWQVDVATSVGTQRLALTARLQELPLAESPRAGGAIGLLVFGSLPLAFAGNCEVRATAAGRVLTLALRRQPGAFEVDVVGVTGAGQGAIEIDASLPFSRPAAAEVAVRIEDMNLSSSTGMQIRGLATRTHLLGLPVPTSPGPQQMSWRSAQIAGVPVGSGNATFHLRAGAELDLQLQQRTLDEVGSIDIRDRRLLRGSPTSPTTIVCDQVPLQGCLELLSRGRITGEGRLSGSLSLLVQIDPRFAIDLRGGQLAAAPGGVVRFLDDAAIEDMVRQHAQHLAGSGHDVQIQEDLVAALRDFGFTALEFRIDAEGEGVSLRVHAAGAGRTVSQHLELDVNVHGFDTLVDTAIAIKLGLDRAKTGISHQIDKQAQNLRQQRKP